jgi:hypothetical protein
MLVRLLSLVALSSLPDSGPGIQVHLGCAKVSRASCAVNWMLASLRDASPMGALGVVSARQPSTRAGPLPARERTPGRFRQPALVARAVRLSSGPKRCPSGTLFARFGLLNALTDCLAASFIPV